MLKKDASSRNNTILHINIFITVSLFNGLDTTIVIQNQYWLYILAEENSLLSLSLYKNLRYLGYMCEN